MVSGTSSSSLLGGHDPAHALGVSIQGQAESLAQDMADLMHDFDVVSRIAGLIGTMKTPYSGLTTEVTAPIMAEIQRSIRQKDEEMSFMDASCLQIAVKGGSGHGGRGETYTFQTRDPNVKREWVVELRLAQLALDPDNSPGWDVLEQERSISTKMPLYVKSFMVHSSGAAAGAGGSKSHHQSTLSLSGTLKPGHTEATGGCSYSLMVQTPTRSMRKHT